MRDRGLRVATVLVAFLAHIVLTAPLARAQATAAGGGGLDGTVSTQGGTVFLPGVLVLVRTASGEQVAEQVSDGEGHFAIDLPAGMYRVNATLDGFDPVERPLTIVAGSRATLSIDMSIAAVSERVDVVASASVAASTSGSLAAEETVSKTETQWFAPGGSVQSALKLMDTVIATPNGESINGGRPDQAGYQIGASSFVDPGTNVARMWLPTDGVDAVSVLANPYEAEYGRFSSGLVVVQTRRASDRMHFAVNNAIPSFRIKRETIADIEGLGAVNPSFELGGPLVKGRLYLEQTAQYHWDTTDVASRPENELKTTQRYGSLTRLDANVSPRHTLIVSGGFAQSDLTHATLGTFTPPGATANIADDVGYAMATERTLVRKATMLETTVQAHWYATDVQGQGSAPMALKPETTVGNFFNQQDRNTSAVQYVETLSTSHNGLGGLHLIKVGADVLWSDYDGTSDSRPVMIFRTDGTLARRLDYAGPTTQQSGATDVAAFIQDRLQPSKEWYIQYGVRVERDALTDDVTTSPRIGAAIVLNSSATAVLRAGYGLFYERTPLVAGAFPTFETAIDSRYATDGLTLLGPPMPMVHIVGDLHGARSSTWDLAYDYRITSHWALHLSVLDRRGEHELILDPVDGGGLTEPIRMSSDGRSHYVQEEIGLHATRGQRLDVSASYVHANAHANLNSFGSFYGAVMMPIVGEDEFAPASTDVRNRLFVRGQVMPRTNWMFTGTFDLRSGMPYSAVDEMLEFVGPRNTLRFPVFARTEMGLDRRIVLGHAHPWLGFRVMNALNAFLPMDVQANVGSPAFGTFYNSEFRQLRIHIRFER